MTTEAWEVDARGLEPPQPMMRILEALATLPPGAGLRARTDRRPMHLYAMIEERGYRAETQMESDGSFVTDIRPV
jgi:TusA-related sulfurtransferase